jgi:hypothetical protein
MREYGCLNDVRKNTRAARKEESKKFQASSCDGVQQVLKVNCNFASPPSLRARMGRSGWWDPHPYTKTRGMEQLEYCRVHDRQWYFVVPQCRAIAVVRKGKTRILVGRVHDYCAPKYLFVDRV